MSTMDTGAGWLLPIATGLTVLGSLALAALLWRHARAAPGARPLVGFLLAGGTWSLGLLIPDWRGGLLLSLAPVGGALFLHFAITLAGRGGRLIAWGYGAGVGAMAVALVAGPGRFVPWPGVGLLFRYDGAGLAAAGLTVAMAGLATALLLSARRGADAGRRAQITLVLGFSLVGLIGTTGLAFPVLGIPAAPWPLLAQPLYLLLLAYAVLRYRLAAINQWAARAVSWALLIGLAGLVSAASAGLAAQQAGAPFGWIAAALLAGLGLAAPLRRLADRIVYPGGDVKEEDLARWRAALEAGGSEAEIAEGAARIRRGRLNLAEGEGVAEAPPGPRRVAAVVADLAEQAKAGLARRRALAERDRLAELGALAATVAHDLRNPMNIIAMAVADSDAATRAEVKTQIGRMDLLVRDLLDYAKPWRLTAAPIVLAEFLGAWAGVARIACPSGPVLNADPERLRQALGNLIDNAHAAAATVEIAVEHDAEGLRIHVCDDGTGIPADIRPALFQPFVSANPGGTGLGLAIVAKVMTAHGGSVRLTERQGWSTCFTLSFPP